MNTDGEPDLQQSINSKLLLKQETHQIIGCAFEVLNELGCGFHEKPYENALVIEFGLKGISYSQQRRFPILYKRMQVAEFVPDLIAFDAIIVDAKVILEITDLERGQMMNYLRIANLRVGLILNFKYPKLQWERIVL